MPPLPEGEIIDTCCDHRKKMVKERDNVQQQEPPHPLKELMDITCPFRRSILTESKPVNILLKYYPALQLPTEVCMCTFQKILFALISSYTISVCNKLQYRVKYVQYNKRVVYGIAFIVKLCLRITHTKMLLETCFR